MRVRTYAWAVAGSVMVTVVGFAGCNGTVTTAGTETTTSGSGGSMGHSGVTVTVSSSSSTTTSATTTSSSSSGGGTLCDQACAHVAQCPGFTCSKIGLDCTTMMSMQFDCVVSCIDNTPCSQLGLGTLQACQAQCNGMDDGGPPPFDGGPPPMDAGPSQQCIQCSSQSCQAQEFACVQDPTCQPWGQCAIACAQATLPSPGCFAACDAMYPQAKPTYDSFYTCLCSHCSTECASANPCAQGMDGGP